MRKFRIFSSWLIILCALSGFSDAILARVITGEALMTNASMQTALLFIIGGLTLDNYLKPRIDAK